jgi:hypothetical protein
MLLVIIIFLLYNETNIIYFNINFFEMLCKNNFLSDFTYFAVKLYIIETSFSLVLKTLVKELKRYSNKRKILHRKHKSLDFCCVDRTISKKF